MQSCAFLISGSVDALVVDIVRRSRSARRILGSVTADVHLHVRDVRVSTVGAKLRTSDWRYLRSLLPLCAIDEPVVKRSARECIVRSGRNELDEAVVVGDTPFPRFSAKEPRVKVAASLVQCSWGAVGLR